MIPYIGPYFQLLVTLDSFCSFFLSFKSKMDGQSKLAAQAFGIVHDHSTKRARREELEQLKQDLQQAQAENDRLKWAHTVALNHYEPLA